MLHQTFLFLGQLWQLFEVSQILEFLRYLVNVFAITTSFHEFAFIVKYCPFTSTFGARSLFSISNKQKKISLTFAQINFKRRMT